MLHVTLHIVFLIGVSQINIIIQPILTRTKLICSYIQYHDVLMTKLPLTYHSSKFQLFFLKIIKDKFFQKSVTTQYNAVKCLVTQTNMLFNPCMHKRTVRTASNFFEPLSLSFYCYFFLFDVTNFAHCSGRWRETARNLPKRGNRLSTEKSFRVSVSRARFRETMIVLRMYVHTTHGLTRRVGPLPRALPREAEFRA